PKKAREERQKNRRNSSRERLRSYSLSISHRGLDPFAPEELRSSTGRPRVPRLSKLTCHSQGLISSDAHRSFMNNSHVV
ncbi:hypothetical protein JMJ77_0003104, partial [Colletotrichum scovillei]